MPETPNPAQRAACGARGVVDLAGKLIEPEASAHSPSPTTAASENVSVLPEARRQLAQVHFLAQALEQASEPEEIRDIETKLDAVEHYMKSAGDWRHRPAVASEPPQHFRRCLYG
jgi:hypothetical protein